MTDESRRGTVARPESSPRQHSTLSSVRNAARLLKEFSGTGGEIGVTEMSRRLDIGKSTAHRLLSTLADEDLLEQNPSTGSYRLGPALLALASPAEGRRG